MKTSTPAILAAALLMLLASACKRNQTNEPAAAEDHAAASDDGPAAETAEAQAPAEAEAPTDATETADSEAATDTAPTASARTISTIPVPADWVKVSAQTPKGVTVSFGVPSEWIEVPPPNEGTLLVRGAPLELAAGGTKATAVAVEFVGGRTELAEYTRNRLGTLATIEREGPLRVGTIDGYEFLAHWATPVGNRDTLQFLVATGKEAVAVTCELPPDKLEALGGLCDEIFATVSIEGVGTD